jgi:hypothetical protein
VAAVVVLVLRLGLSAALYAFLGWAFWLIWSDLRAQSRLISNQQVPELALTLLWLTGKETLHFSRTPITLGRNLDCECRIDDQTVSNRHAQISFHHNQWWLEDLGSTNGTLLNGQPLTEAVVLIGGDQMQCGQVSMEVAIDPTVGGISSTGQDREVR